MMKEWLIGMYISKSNKERKAEKRERRKEDTVSFSTQNRVFKVKI